MNASRTRSCAEAPARVWLLALALGGCSWLVNPEKEAPRCAVDAGHDPCEEGTQCMAGRCRVIDCSGPEICGDHIDNNCDGTTDERTEDEEMCNFADDDCDGLTDEGFDRDGDTFTWCGDVSHDNTRDCDEINPNVHPGATEICDGIDNDCNQLIDEVTAGDSLCNKPELCLGGRCVIPSCAIEGSGQACRADENCVLGECLSRVCNAMMCSPGASCDQASGSCMEPPPLRKNGEPCSTGSDCISALCIDAAALRMPGQTGRICGKACCKDAPDCAPDEACFASGTGARSCLPRGEVPVASECSNDDGCASAERCGIGRVQNTGNEGRAPYSTSLCRAPEPPDVQPDFSAACALSESCFTRLCVPDPLSLFGACSKPCGISSECAGLYNRDGVSWTPSSLGPPHEYCRVVDLGQLIGAPGPGDHAAVCVMDYETGGGKKFGETCGANNECADGACITGADSKGYCAPTCCNDLQCEGMDAGHKGARCIPMARGGHYEMRCTP